MAMPTLPGSIAYEELTNNDLTDEGYKDLVAAARMAMNNPSNEGIRAEISQRLSEPEELVSELATSYRLHQLVQRSISATHFARSLPRAFKDLMRDLARRSDSGAFAYRIVTTLRTSATFQQVPEGPNQGRWTTSELDPDAMWVEDENALVNATWRFEVAPVTEWSGDRRTPVCSDDDLVSILKAVLNEACAPLPATEIIRALRHRFQLLFTDPEQIDDTLIDVASSESVEEQVVVASEAEELLQILTSEEMDILKSEHLSVRELGDKLGCSKSAAAAKRQKLRRFLSDSWTTVPGSTSSESESPAGEHP